MSIAKPRRRAPIPIAPLEDTSATVDVLGSLTTVVGVVGVVRWLVEGTSTTDVVGVGPWLVEGTSTTCVVGATGATGVRVLVTLQVALSPACSVMVLLTAVTPFFTQL